MSKSVNQTYNKYFVKKDHNSGSYMTNDDGTPVLGELAKTNVKCPENFIKILNDTWHNSGEYYQLVTGKSEQGDGGKSQERIELENEANELGVTFRDNIGDAKLKQKIEEAKQV